MTQNINYDQIAPGSLTPFSSTPGAPASPAMRATRVLVNEAKDYGLEPTGSVTNGGWLNGFEGPSGTITGWRYFLTQSANVTVRNNGLAITAATRTSGGQLGISMSALAIADAANGLPVWPLYVDGGRTIAGSGTASIIEANGFNLPGTSPGNSGISDFWRYGKTPYKAPVSGEVSVLNLGGGSDAAIFGRSYAVDAAINIGNNGAAFWAGLNFRHDALMRENTPDDKTSPLTTQGYARAISMAYDQGLSWYSQDAVLVTAGAFVTGRAYIIQSVGTTDFTLIGASANTVGAGFTATGAGTGTGTATLSGSQAEAVRMWSSVADDTVKWGMNWTDVVWSLQERSGTGAALLQVLYRSDAAANLTISAGGTGGSPVLGAAGAATNIPITLAPKGTGWVSFGSINNCHNYADDAAAALGGVNVGGIYRTGSALKVRAA